VIDRRRTWNVAQPSTVGGDNVGSDRVDWKRRGSALSRFGFEEMVLTQSAAKKA